MRKEEIAPQVYDFIDSYIDQNGFSPSLREIAEGCYVSTAYVVRCLDFLEARGHLSREMGKARSIQLLKDKNEEQMY